MAEQIQAVRGMNDVLPTEIGSWQYFETCTRELLSAYGYEEIRVPIVEHTELFKRAIGEHTDVVGKEMYTFTDRGGDSLTLRPEATAGVVRALISNGLLRGQRHKLWCMGPMFRHETPQAGRYRQFWQVDVEAVGCPGPDVDAELIALSARLWRRLGILDGLSLQINSLGTPESRREYRARLVEYLRAHEARLDADSLRRLGGNPLRVLDSKNPDMQELIAGAPLLTEHLDAESRAHFEALCAMLREVGVSYEINPRLVRGLDYYNRTVFEWITGSTGAQNAVCSGGRYDGLIAQLGGDATPAIGFAMGVERLVALVLAARGAPPPASPGRLRGGQRRAAAAQALALVERLRSERPALRFELNLGGGNFKAQFRRADKSGAPLALIIGDDELARGVVAMKPLRAESGQSECPIAQLAAALDAALAGGRLIAGRCWGGSVEDYLSEKEQWEWIKAQVRENALAVILVIAGTVGCVYGWRWWQSHVDAGRLDAGAKYTQMTQALDNGDRTRALVVLGELEREHAGSPYTDQAQLLAARLYVVGNELDHAADRAHGGGRAFEGPRARTAGAAASGPGADWRRANPTSRSRPSTRSNRGHSPPATTRRAAMPTSPRATRRTRSRNTAAPSRVTIRGSD